MIEQNTLLLLILGCAVVTYLARALPLQIDTKRLPNWAKLSLEFLPASIIAAITLSPILLDSYINYFISAEFIAAIFTISLAIYSKNILITLFLSLLFYLLINHYFF